MSRYKEKAPSKIERVPYPSWALPSSSSSSSSSSNVSSNRHAASAAAVAAAAAASACNSSTKMATNKSNNNNNDNSNNKARANMTQTARAYSNKKAKSRASFNSSTKSTKALTSYFQPVAAAAAAAATSASTVSSVSTAASTVVTCIKIKKEDDSYQNSSSAEDSDVEVLEVENDDRKPAAAVDCKDSLVGNTAAAAATNAMVYDLTLDDSSDSDADFDGDDNDSYIVEIGAPKQQQQQQPPPAAASSRKRKHSSTTEAPSAASLRVSATNVPPRSASAPKAIARPVASTRNVSAAAAPAPVITTPPPPQVPAATNNNDNQNNNHNGDYDHLDPIEAARLYKEEKMQRNLKYTLQQVIEMWKSVEVDNGAETEYLETSDGIRKANHRLEKTESTLQSKAQYGRIKFLATDVVFQILQLNRDRDLFLDIGHGIGNTPAQAAYERQCDARGIELVRDRNAAAVAIELKLRTIREHLHRDRDHKEYEVGRIEFREGRLEDLQHRAFLTNPGPDRTTIKAFCNNFNGVFAEKSATASDQNKFLFLDHFIAGLLAGMPPGSILLTLHPLPISIPPRSQVLRARLRNKLYMDAALESNASFYEMEAVSLGDQRHAVTWAAEFNDKPLEGYKYTRLAQQKGDEAVFLCSNPHCTKAQEATPTGATCFVPRKGTNEQGIVLKNGCDCHWVGAGMTLRRRRCGSVGGGGGKK